MITVNIRRQGSSAIMTIPSDALKIIGAEVGDTLTLEVQPGQFVARPMQKAARKRYKLSDLLEGVTQERVDRLIGETSWAQDGGPVGQEIA